MTCLVYLPNEHRDLESYLCSLESAAEFLAQSYSDGKQLDTLSLTSTAKKLSNKEYKMESLTKHQSFRMSGNSLAKVMPKSTEGMSMLSAENFRANHTLRPVKNLQKKTSEICGPQPPSVSELSSRHIASLKMSEESCQPTILEKLSKPYPISGIVCDGKFYRQPRLEPRIKEIESGLWPTPTGQMARPDMNRVNRPMSGGDDLGTKIKKLYGGKTSADWTDWIMGLPIGASALSPLPMHRFLLWLQRHGISCHP